MILDAIIGLFGSLIEGVAAVFVPLINLIAALIELIVGIFVSGFTLGRIKREKREPKSAGAAVGGVVTLVIIIGAIAWFFVAPKVMKRTVTLIAEDGHSLPFAALILHTGGGEKRERTDNSGNIVIPRFGVTGITVKDPRYVEKTWQASDIESKLIVKRTVLGACLDIIGSRLLKPAKE